MKRTVNTVMSYVALNDEDVLYRLVVDFEVVEISLFEVEQCFEVFQCGAGLLVEVFEEAGPAFPVSRCKKLIKKKQTNSLVVLLRNNLLINNALAR